MVSRVTFDPAAEGHFRLGHLRHAPTQAQCFPQTALAQAFGGLFADKQWATQVPQSGTVQSDPGRPNSSAP